MEGRMVEDVTDAYETMGICTVMRSQKWLFNFLVLLEGNDFGALHGQQRTHFDRSTKLDLTTEQPLWGRCCYALLFFVFEFVKDLDEV